MRHFIIFYTFVKRNNDFGYGMISKVQDHYPNHNGVIQYIKDSYPEYDSIVLNNIIELNSADYISFLTIDNND